MALTDEQKQQVAEYYNKRKALEDQQYLQQQLKYQQAINTGTTGVLVGGGGYSGGTAGGAVGGTWGPATTLLPNPIPPRDIRIEWLEEELALARRAALDSATREARVLTELHMLRDRFAELLALDEWMKINKPDEYEEFKRARAALKRITG